MAEFDLDDDSDVFEIDVAIEDEDDATLAELVGEFDDAGSGESTEECEALLLEDDSELEIALAEDSTLLDELDAEAWTTSLDSSVLYEEVPTENAPNHVIESGMLVITQPEEILTNIDTQFEIIATEHHVGLRVPDECDLAAFPQNVNVIDAGDELAEIDDVARADKLAEIDELAGADETTETVEAVELTAAATAETIGTCSNPFP